MNQGLVPAGFFAFLSVRKRSQWGAKCERQRRRYSRSLPDRDKGRTWRLTARARGRTSLKMWIDKIPF